MGRLPGFDYKRPYFYMVTLKRCRGLAPFSEIAKGNMVPCDLQGRKLYLKANDITAAFSEEIRKFTEKWRGLQPIEVFAVMPDHIHLLLHIQETGDRFPLGKYVYQLEKALAKRYWEIEGKGRRCGLVHNSDSEKKNGQSGAGAVPCAPIFEQEWHDWIVMKDGQLKAFTRYIRENPKRAWQREQNRQYFSQARSVEFAGREWKAYGNTALLDLPVIEPFRCSRKWEQGGKEWREAVGRAERIGPGGAGVGTFMSACEKECGNAIYKAGGSLIVLCPEGFGERWHPTRNKEALCAKGRMLFLTLYEPETKRPDRTTLYKRCHEMGDLIVGRAVS